MSGQKSSQSYYPDSGFASFGFLQASLTNVLKGFINVNLKTVITSRYTLQALHYQPHTLEKILKRERSTGRFFHNSNGWVYRVKHLFYAHLEDYKKVNAVKL